MAGAPAVSSDSGQAFRLTYMRHEAGGPISSTTVIQIRYMDNQPIEGHLVLRTRNSAGTSLIAAVT